jgi:membrane-associated protease RseP (regulator of RpoE activity)
MFLLKLWKIGLTLALMALAPARAQQPNPPPSVDLFRGGGAGQARVGESQVRFTEAQPNWSWVFLGSDSDAGSGLQVSALDDAARAHLKLPKGEGLLVVALAPNCPAAQAGIIQNDILLSLDDATLAKPEDLDARLKAAGDKPLTLDLLHHGQKKTLKVQPQVRVTFGPVPRESSSFWLGVQVSALEPALRSHLSLPQDRGLLVTEVVADGPAAKAGVKVNDILLTLAGTPLKDQQGLVEDVQRLGEKAAVLELVREGARQTIEVAPQKRTLAAITADGVTLRNGVARYNFFRPGVVYQSEPQRRGFYYDPSSNVQHGTGFVTTDVFTTGTGSPPEKRIEALDAEIKELRKAVEELTKAVKDRR